MADSNNSKLLQLQQPAKLDDVLAEQQKDYDCLPCRAMGALFLTNIPHFHGKQADDDT